MLHLQLTVILRCRREQADMLQRKKLVSEQLDITSWQDLDDPKGVDYFGWTWKRVPEGTQADHEQFGASCSGDDRRVSPREHCLCRGLAEVRWPVNFVFGSVRILREQDCAET